jgi:hypothetical protein
VLRQDFPYFVQYDVSPEEAAREAGAGLVGDWLEAMLHKEPGLQDDVHTWTSAIESTFSPGAAAQPGPGNPNPALCHVAWGGGTSTAVCSVRAPLSRTACPWKRCTPRVPPTPPACPLSCPPEHGAEEGDDASESKMGGEGGPGAMLPFVGEYVSERTAVLLLGGVSLPCPRLFPLVWQAYRHSQALSHPLDSSLTSIPGTCFCCTTWSARSPLTPPCAPSGSCMGHWTRSGAGTEAVSGASPLPIGVGALWGLLSSLQGFSLLPHVFPCWCRCSLRRRTAGIIPVVAAAGRHVKENPGLRGATEPIMHRVAMYGGVNTALALSLPPCTLHAGFIYGLPPTPIPWLVPGWFKGCWSTWKSFRRAWTVSARRITSTRSWWVSRLPVIVRTSPLYMECHPWYMC